MRVEAINRRRYWVEELASISGSFSNDSTRMIRQLQNEITTEGPDALLDHLRTCGAMPERYQYDSSEEKLYSKYTDALLSEALGAMGFQSHVITARGDAADIQARSDSYSLVADAKAFRLSRTAKNQKDFKVQSMDSWRNGLDYALLVCPIYQLPGKTSQIYQQAIARNVCILSYTHLAVLVGLTVRRFEKTVNVFEEILRSLHSLHPSKDAVGYWRGVNRSLVYCLGEDVDLWTMEKTVSLDALNLAKQEALGYLRLERDRLLGLSREEAVGQLIRQVGLNSRIARVEHIQHGALLGGE